MNTMNKQRKMSQYEYNDEPLSDIIPIVELAAIMASSSGDDNVVYIKTPACLDTDD